MSDLIKRSDAIKALYKYSFVSKDIIEREINAIPSAEPSVGYVGVDDDYLVSVKEVLNITAETGALETQRRVKELPRRDRTQGEWINEREWANGFYERECSICGAMKPILMHTAKVNFCPNCGADMRGEDDGRWQML